MRIRPFLVMTLIGSFAWSAILTYLGYTAGQGWNSAVANSSPFLTNVVLGIVAVLSVAYIVYFYATRDRNAAKQLGERSSP
jgi:membrane protein DedA with SNARE-associated domain